MSGVHEAIALIEATPVEDLVQSAYIERVTTSHIVEGTNRGLDEGEFLPCRCPVGVLAHAAGVPDAVLTEHECTKIERVSDIAWPVMNQFGLRIGRLRRLQAAFDDAPDPATGKDAALTLLRRWS